MDIRNNIGRAEVPARTLSVGGLVDRLANILSNGGKLNISVERGNLEGLKLEVSKGESYCVVDSSIERTAALEDMYRLSSVMYPSVARDTEAVDTLYWPGGYFEYLHPGLRGPNVSACQSRAESLLLFLARTTSQVAKAHGMKDGIHGFGKRFVEPGIGRSVLVPLLRIEGRRELVDFSVLGVGLTPYSEQEFVMVGPEVDGLVSLVKARHRKMLAEKLASIGCRVPVTCAVIPLPGLLKTWPDGRQTTAALLVRASKMNLRIQQLDPFHGFFHTTKLQSSMRECFRRLNSATSSPLVDDVDGDALAECCKHIDIRAIVYKERYGGVTTPKPVRTGRGLRFKEVASFAPFALEVAKQRLASELCSDQVFTNREYAVWFGTSMGEQLAKMRDARFLFDYRPGRSPKIANALHESQISLLAEFHDLDTGIFVDSRETEGVLLTQMQIDELKTNFEAHHVAEYKEAFAIVRTLALVACSEDHDAVAAALSAFQSRYEGKTGKTVSVSSSDWLRLGSEE